MKERLNLKKIGWLINKDEYDKLNAYQRFKLKEYYPDIFNNIDFPSKYRIRQSKPYVRKTVRIVPSIEQYNEMCSSRRRYWYTKFPDYYPNYRIPGTRNTPPTLEQYLAKSKKDQSYYFHRYPEMNYPYEKRRKKNN